MQLQFDTKPREAQQLKPEELELSALDVLDAISRFDAIGL